VSSSFQNLLVYSATIVHAIKMINLLRSWWSWW